VHTLISLLRAYWTAALLAAAAVVLLSIWSPSKAALAGAGFALAGAAITRWIDLAKNRQATSAQETQAQRRDLDETRRLAEALLFKRPSERDPVLLATVLNALVYHGLRVDYLTASRHLTRIDTGQDHDMLSTHWLQAQIELITHRLSELSPRAQREPQPSRQP